VPKHFHPPNITLTVSRPHDEVYTRSLTRPRRGVEKLGIAEIRDKFGDRKCLAEQRESFVGILTLSFNYLFGFLPSEFFDSHRPLRSLRITGVTAILRDLGLQLQSRFVGESVWPSFGAAGHSSPRPDASFMRGVPLNANRRRPRIRSWAERHHFAIGLALTLVGLAAVGAICFLGVRGSLATATMIGAFAAFALLFGKGFRGAGARSSRPLRSINQTMEVPGSRGPEASVTKTGKLSDQIPHGARFLPISVRRRKTSVRPQVSIRRSWNLSCLQMKSQNSLGCPDALS
jgi:hypothetical protein